MVVVVAQETGTVMVWFGSASQVTVPSAATLTYLYTTTCPAVRGIVTDHKGLVDVYWLALRAMASLVSQLPRASISPLILMVSP